MASDKALDESFTNAYNEAHKLWDEDKLEECIEKARELLEQPGIPRYHRMKTLILLGSTLGDWDEANACREEADLTWRIVRRWHPVGENANNDEVMAELRSSIDELAQALADEEPEDYDEDADADMEERVRLHDEAVEKEKAHGIADHGTEEERLAADAYALGKTTEELGKLDITKSHVQERYRAAID